MADPPTAPGRSARAPFRHLVLTCGKCERKLGGHGFGGRRGARKALKAAAKTASRAEGRGKIRVAEVSCLGLCPKRRQALASPEGLAGRRLLVVSAADDPAAVLERLLPPLDAPTPFPPSPAEPDPMTEIFDPAALASDRAERYREVEMEVAAVLAGQADRVARMATVSAMLHAAFAPRFSWTGFYVVDPVKPDELVVGPYQGALGCLRIAFGRGVCGAAAQARAPVIVPDVEAFPGHIACDARTRSEVVLPVFDPAGALIAVLDVDSAEPDAFDGIDVQGLSAILAASFAAVG